MKRGKGHKHQAGSRPWVILLRKHQLCWTTKPKAILLEAGLWGDTETPSSHPEPVWSAGEEGGRTREQLLENMNSLRGDLATPRLSSGFRAGWPARSALRTQGVLLIQGWTHENHHQCPHRAKQGCKTPPSNRSCWFTSGWWLWFVGRTFSQVQGRFLIEIIEHLRLNGLEMGNNQGQALSVPGLELVGGSQHKGCSNPAPMSLIALPFSLLS